MPLDGVAGGCVDLGTTYGCWRVPAALIEPGWIGYSVGAGGDVSFDVELMRRYQMTVRAFDPVAEYVDNAIGEAAGDPHFTVMQAAIATSDGPLRMQVTHHPGSRSVSPAGLYETADYVELPGRTLPSLMDELGDDRIDLLKLDIEGGEYELIPSLDLRGLGVKVFATQLHHTGTVRQAEALVSGLRDAGYKLVACIPSVKLTFVRRELEARRRP